MLVDQLRHVLVAGGDHHRTAGVGALARQGADYVVGLYAVNAQQRQAECANGGVQGLDLGAQVIGHGRAMRLVLLEHLVAEGRPLGVEYHGNRAAGILLEQAFQHVQHAFHGAGRLPLAGSQGWQRVEGAIKVGRAVHQDERCGVCHASGQQFRSQWG